MALILRQTIKPAGTFPAVEAADVLMPDGTRLSEFEGGGVLLVTPTDGGGVSHNFEQILEASLKGQLSIFFMNGEVYSLTRITETYADYVRFDADEATANIIGNAVRVADDHYMPISMELYGLPKVTADDNGKILQVVNGKWQSVAMSDSTVKDYIDEYISTNIINGNEVLY